MTDKEKIRAKVERVANFYYDEERAAEALNDILMYIDSLPKEPISENLEQAIDTYLATYWGGEQEKQDWPFLKKMAIHFAEWQKKQLQRDDDSEKMKHQPIRDEFLLVNGMIMLYAWLIFCIIYWLLGFSNWITAVSNTLFTAFLIYLVDIERRRIRNKKEV